MLLSELLASKSLRMSESFYHLTKSSELNLKIKVQNIFIWPWRSAMFLASADPDIFRGGGGGGGPTENALVLLYDTLISGFQWM